MVWGSEDLLNPERAEKLSPNGADELPAKIGEKSSGSAKVEDDMSHEGLTDCARSVITGGDEDGVFAEAVHKNNQELVHRSGGRGPTISMKRVSQGPWD